jgi:ABC-type transporter Mla subunit MlaD
MHNKLTIAAPLVALVIAVAGCGGSDSNEFIESYNETTAPLQELTTELGSAAGGGAGAEKQLNQMADGLDDVRTKLTALEPPDGAQDELDAMVSALDDTANQVREIAKSAKSGDVEALTAAATELGTTGQALADAETKLKTAVEG